MADGDALHIARTKASSAVGFRRHLKNGIGLFFRCALKAQKAGGPASGLQPWSGSKLLELDLRAGFFELFLGGLGIGLVGPFLDRLGCAVDQVLGFLEAQAGDFAHGLDDRHLIGAGFGQLNMGHAFTSGNTVRMDNTLMYKTPTMSGFQAGVGYSFATGLTSNGGTTGYGFATSNNSRELTVGARYANGPVYVAASYEKAYAANTSAANGQSVNSWTVAGTYDFKVVKLAAGYGQTRDGFWAGSGAGGAGAQLAVAPNSTSNALVFAPNVGYNSYIVGATVPVNATSRVLLSWTMITPNSNLKDAFNASNQSSYNLGYTYDFTKRTNLYTYVGQSVNYATVDTAKSTVVGIGMRHAF